MTAFARIDTRADLAASIGHRLFPSGQHSVLAEHLNLMALSEGALNALTPAQVHAIAEQIAPTVPSGTGDQIDLVRRVDVRGDLAVPTLVVVTTAAPLIFPAQQRQLAAAIPTAETAELPTGHLSFVERPQEWLKLVSDFVARS